MREAFYSDIHVTQYSFCSRTIGAKIKLWTGNFAQCKGGQRKEAAASMKCRKTFYSDIQVRTLLCSRNMCPSTLREDFPVDRECVSVPCYRDQPRSTALFGFQHRSTRQCDFKVRKLFLSKVFKSYRHLSPELKAKLCSGGIMPMLYEISNEQ